MGQALDRDGNVLGEAFGGSKREVFDTLMREHADAAEIRIRSMFRPGDEESHQAAGASAELPRYKCHKEVWALKIAAVTRNSVLAQLTGNESDGSAVITPVDDRYGDIRVDADYLRRHNPQVGGYYVVYADGYTSFSPADAFESGYTRIP